ncbi:MAG: toll/interleukin-1 receptor domain-containing protein [Gammaproteobacteria bacterium]|nr:toll/interleukin-1 receptor domain-containing protein [Gammaproteobacteria bacterium]
MNLFISYSHKDEAALERLRTHLAVMQQTELIDGWFDQKILPGSHIDAEITEQIESAELFLFLVSPNFLDSDYCVNNEMKRALERHEAGEARVIPVILEPCDWRATPLGNLKALPKDGCPISKWTNENDAYLDVVRELRRALDAGPKSNGKKTGVETVSHSTRQAESRGYRVKRGFDEIDHADFRKKSFEVIRDYFKSALAEFDQNVDLKGRFSSLSDYSFTCTIVNKLRRNSAAHITIHEQSQFNAFGDISYSYSKNADPHTASGYFTIADDEYELYLVLHAFNVTISGNQTDRFSPETAARRLWESFLEQAGISRE